LSWRGDQRPVSLFDWGMPKMTSESSSQTYRDSAVRDVNQIKAIHDACNFRIAPENWVAFFFIGDFFFFLLTASLSGRFLDLFEGADGVPGPSRLVGVAVAIFLHLIFTHILNVYDRKYVFDFKYVSQRIVISTVIVIVLLLTLLFMSGLSDAYSSRWFFTWFFLNLVMLVGYRQLALRFVRRRLENGAFVEKAVSVALFCEPLSSEAIAASTYHTVKIAHSVKLESVLELPDSINKFMQDEIDCVYIVVPWVDAPLILQQLTQLRQFAARIFVIPDERRIRANHLGITTFGDNVAITAVDRPLDGWGLWTKRVQDLIVAGTLLAAIAPLMAAIAIAVKLESPGPVFFKQRRTGFNGSLFELWKFRSMYADKADYTASIQTSKGDPRVTRVGRIIRKTSLDELPQLINVLQGHMSIVGPRPHALQTRAEGKSLEELAEKYAARHRVKPGLTGWAQVCGYRGELDSVEKVRRRVAHDIEYIENWSTFFDIKIILKTALLVFHDPAAF
jgi:polysaccharide biosynthesis protein PslA